VTTRSGIRALAPWPYPRLAAHRGAGKLAPENTLAAFRLGYAHGYRMAELDVKLSADGVAFLLHDNTLDRTTNVRGRADALNWRQLSLLDAGSWHSPAGGWSSKNFAVMKKSCACLSQSSSTARASARAHCSMIRSWARCVASSRC